MPISRIKRGRKVWKKNRGARKKKTKKKKGFQRISLFVAESVLQLREKKKFDKSAKTGLLIIKKFNFWLRRKEKKQKKGKRRKIKGEKTKLFQF